MKLIIMLLFVSGCAATTAPNLITNSTTVFVPDAQLFNCPTVKQFPDVATLTDADVAELLITLNSYNHICAASLAAVREQLLSAQNQLGA